MTSLNLTHLHLTNKPLNRQQGFTLIEILIAIAIFASVSLAGVSIFQTVTNTDQATKARVERFNELQRAFLIIERDIIQIARRSVRFEGEAPLTEFIYIGDNNISQSENGIAFVRHGWTNPGLLLPRSDMQSVAYRLNDDVLERLHFNFVDAVVGEEPKVRALLHGVDNIDFEFYYDKEWQSKLTKGVLPRAIALEIDFADQGLIRRQFLVAGEQVKKGTKRGQL